MIIIIVISGIIVFGVIITVKYYKEEDENKIGPTLKRVVIWQSHEDTIVDDPMKVKRTVTGKDVSNMLDTIFFYFTYGLHSYCDTSYSKGGMNQMWILKNSKDMLEYIQSTSLSSCNSIKHLTSLLSTQLFLTLT